MSHASLHRDQPAHRLALATRASLLLATAACVAAALVGKAWRYGSGPALNDRALQRAAVTEALAPQGWRAKPGLGAARDAPYDWIVLEHGTCPTAIAVAMLPANADLRDLIDRDSGSNALFVVAGRLVRSTDLASALLLSKATALLPGRLGVARGDTALPMLAIAPAQAIATTGCPLPFAPPG